MSGQAFVQQTGNDVFLLIGQTNMMGASATVSGTLDYTTSAILQLGQNAATGNNNVVITASDPLEHAALGTGPGIGSTFARAYNTQTGRRVLLVPCAYPNSGFSSAGTATTLGGDAVTVNWLAGVPNNLLALAIRRATIAMAYNATRNPLPAYAGNVAPAPDLGNAFKGILFLSGTTDTLAGMSEASYRSSLVGMVSALRAGIPDATNAPFLAGFPSDAFVAGVPSAGPLVVLPRVGDAAYLGLTNCSFVASSGLETQAGSTLYTEVGIRAYGQRYLAAFNGPVAASTATVSNVSAVCGAFAGGASVSWTSGSGTANVIVAGTAATAPSFQVSGPAPPLYIPPAQLRENTTYSLTLRPFTAASVEGATAFASLAVPFDVEPAIASASANVRAQVKAWAWSGRGRRRPCS